MPAPFSFLHAQAGAVSKLESNLWVLLCQLSTGSLSSNLFLCSHCTRGWKQNQREMLPFILHIHMDRSSLLTSDLFLPGCQCGSEQHSV